MLLRGQGPALLASLARWIVTPLAFTLPSATNPSTNACRRPDFFVKTLRVKEKQKSVTENATKSEHESVCKCGECAFEGRVSDVECEVGTECVFVGGAQVSFRELTSSQNFYSRFIGLRLQVHTDLGRQVTVGSVESGEPRRLNSRLLPLGLHLLLTSRRTCIGNIDTSPLLLLLWSFVSFDKLVDGGAMWLRMFRCPYPAVGCPRVACVKLSECRLPRTNDSFGPRKPERISDCRLLPPGTRQRPA